MKLTALCCLALAATLACGSTTRSRGGADQLGGAAGAASGGTGGEAGSCQAPAAGLVRLAFPELVDSVGGLLGEEAGRALAGELELRDDDRAFPALAREGPYVHERLFERSDRLAQWLGRHARDNFASVTACSPDYDCVRDFVTELADRAFRRPLSSEEEQALLLTVERAEALGASPAHAAEYGVQAVFSSPHFLYRTELGSPDDAMEGEQLLLTDHELASELSFFVTGRAPDAFLRAAADAGALKSAAGRAEQLQRLLQEPVARLHLRRALAAHFQASRLESVVLDPVLYPIFSTALVSSMRVELDALFERAVVGGSSAADLLTTRAARIDVSLAALYGIEFPPSGTLPDVNGFADVELPESRAGVLTRSGWSMLHTAPDGPQILSRGAAVRALVLCDTRVYAEPHPPASPMAMSSDAERARSRLADVACADCHAELDSFGIALDHLDALGRVRSQDAQGQAIDASVTLPRAVGGSQVRGAAELSLSLPAEAFAACLAQELFGYALGSEAVAQRGDACQREELAVGADATLSDIVEHIVRSPRFTVRRR